MRSCNSWFYPSFIVQRASFSTALHMEIPHHRIPRSIWRENAYIYQNKMKDIMYPKNPTRQASIHAINSNPIYNFIHRYYSFSIKYLLKYSPGYQCLLEDANVSDIDKGVLHDAFFKLEIPSSSSSFSSLPSISSSQLPQSPSALSSSSSSAVYKISLDDFQDYLLNNNGRYRNNDLFFSYQILKNTAQRPPFLGCFGFHEWAMLYSNLHNEGRSHENPIEIAATAVTTTTMKNEKKSHQNLPLRVSQETINTIVQTKGNLKCTHFDALRFFQQNSSNYNIYPKISRDEQHLYDQPGCIHVNMDLFKYAYQLYPLIPSELLLKCLELALEARSIDMRASPYDVSSFQGCELPIKVETPDGRKEYIQLQDSLYQKGKSLRLELLRFYEIILKQTTPEISTTNSNNLN